MKNIGRVRPITAIICDDIRRETNGKDILIGVYSGEMILNQIPALMPIGLYIVFSAVELGPVDAKIELRSSKMIGTLEIHIEVKQIHDERSPIAFAFAGIPLQIESEGTISLLFQQDDGEWEMIRNINVRVLSDLPAPAPIPRPDSSTGRQQQPSRSPDDVQG
jgi:hypothetical protein